MADIVMVILDQGYLVRCDVDDHEGRGEIYVSNDKANAKRFADLMEAMAYWKRPSNIVPLRPDGRPNRPLTAFSVTVEPAVL